MTAALVLSLLCFVLHWVGLFGGFSLFSRAATFYATLLHGLGTALTAWFVLDGWSASSYWGIWFFCSFVPALQEVFVLLRMFVLRVIEY